MSLQCVSYNELAKIDQRNMESYQETLLKNIPKTQESEDNFSLSQTTRSSGYDYSICSRHIIRACETFTSACSDDDPCVLCYGIGIVIPPDTIRVQSSDIIREEESKTTDEQVNVKFTDNEESSTVLKNSTSMWYQPTLSKNADLNEYLSRPVRIWNIDVTAGSILNFTKNPWHAFFNHDSIRRKIDNYAWIRCDLHIKVVVNASPFYYGAFLMSYKPLKGELDSAPVNITLGDRNVPYSQLPHVYIYPQNSQGGELICPFVSSTEWLDLGDSLRLNNFGTLNFSTLAPLAYANSGSASDIDVTFYAWAENVQLSGLTVDLAVQSKDGEYKRDGVISKPASAIARASGMLSDLPFIGPFATATSIGADAVSSIANLFGYTKVPCVTDTVPTKNLPFRAMAVSDISDPTEKLSLDSKNELTINNQCIGDPVIDNLMISDFVQRGSYLTSFTWSAASSIDTLLWNSYVNPYMSSVTADTQQTIINPTPMWVVSNMFEYWRGDMIFDFKLICSQYHRGRLRFSWDPKGDIANTADATSEVYNHIVDICDDTNVSIRVPYCQRVAYCKVPELPTSNMFGTSPLASDHSDTVNGILTVRVLTEQTSPVSSADITVLVSVRGAENMEFAAPKEIDQQIGFFTVQSKDLNDVDEVCFGGPSKVDENVNLVYMGEKVTSLRELMQRSNFHRMDVVSEGNLTVSIYTQHINRRPIYPGFDPNGIDTATGLVSAASEPYNFVRGTPYHLLTSCFLGERGSISWHVNMDSFQGQTMRITRSSEIKTAAKYLPVLTGSISTTDVTARVGVTNISSEPGALLVNTKTNTGVSVCAPMYNQRTFLDTKPSLRTLGLSNYSSTDTLSLVYNSLEWKERGTDFYPIERWFNCGPDHSLVYFLNVPTLYRYNTIPAVGP